MKNPVGNICYLVKLVTFYNNWKTFDEDAIQANSVARIIRSHLLQADNSFKDRFTTDCQMKSVDLLLTSFLTNLFRTTVIGENSTCSQPVTLCQLITYNIHSNRTSTQSSTRCHHESTRLHVLPV